MYEHRIHLALTHHFHLISKQQGCKGSGIVVNLEEATNQQMEIWMTVRN